MEKVNIRMIKIEMVIFEIFFIFMEDSKIKVTLIRVSMIMANDSLSCLSKLNSKILVFENIIIDNIRSEDVIIISILSLFQNVNVNRRGMRSLYKS